MDAVLLALGQQIRHALEADGERGHVVQQRRGRRGQDARHAETDQHKVEADDVSVIRVDPVHEADFLPVLARRPKCLAKRALFLHNTK